MRNFNPLYAVMNQALSSFFTFTVLIVASRVLTTDEFGVYSLLALMLGLFSLAPQAFVFMPMMSASADLSALSQRISSDLILLCVILLASLAFGMALYYFNIDRIGAFVSLSCLIVWVISFQLHEFMKRVFYIGDRHGDLVFLELVKSAVAAIIIILVYLSNKTIDINTILMTSSLAYAAFIFFAARAVKVLRSLSMSDVEVFSTNYAFGKWIFLGNGVNYIQSNFFVFVTALLLPMHTVAGLNAVRSLVGFSTVIFLAIDNYLAPKLVRTYERQGLSALTDSVAYFYVKCGLGIAVIYVGLGYFSESVVITVFGDKYSDSSGYLNYFLIVSFFGYLARPFLILSRTIHATDIIFRASVGPAIFALIFSYPIVMLFGDIGAILMPILGSILFLISLWALFWHNTKTQEKISS